MPGWELAGFRYGSDGLPHQRTGALHAADAQVHQALAQKTRFDAPEQL